MAEVAPAIDDAARRLGELFEAAGFELYVVGGAVRDQLLGQTSSADDIDLTTDARPPDILKIVDPIATAVWRQGEKFGTIGATVFGRDVEITTYRSEVYQDHSRKPVVGFGNDLHTDLSRRDFTINAMARSARSGELRDPFDGAVDLERHLLRTPLSPEISFSDDPLRILRAARFAARLGLAFDPELLTAAKELAPRVEIVSGERIFVELDRLLATPDPTIGVRFLWDNGVMAAAFDRAPLPSFGTVADAFDRMSTDDPVDRPVRWAALSRLAGVDVADLDRRLKLSTERSKELHMLTETAMTDGDDVQGMRKLIVRPGRAEVRRLVELERILAATPEADLRRFDLAFTALADAEPAESLRAPLSGSEIIALTGIEPGPLVGSCQRHLESLAIQNGPLSKADAKAAVEGYLDARDR